MERNSKEALSFAAKWRRLFRSELKLIILAGFLPLLFLGLLVGGIAVWAPSSTYAEKIKVERGKVVKVDDVGEDYTTTLPSTTATVEAYSFDGSTTVDRLRVDGPPVDTSGGFYHLEKNTTTESTNAYSTDMYSSELNMGEDYTNPYGL